MKKLTKLLSLILSLVVAFSLFTACGEKEGGDEPTTTITKVANSSRVDLYNFEQWKPDFSCIKGQKLFGVVKRNKDKEYCKSGDYSAKIMPIGGHIDPSTPILWFPVSSEAWNFGYNDFSYVDYVSFWIYNANDVEKDVTVGLISQYKTHESITQLQGQTYGLKPGEWTLINYVIDFGAMTVGSVVDRDDMLSVQGIYMQWETAPSPDTALAPVYYVDDISLIYKETINGFDSPLNFDQNADVKYLIDFDEPWHDSLAYSKVVASHVFSAPTTKTVYGKDVGVQPTTGSRMLEYKIGLMKASDYTGTYHWTYLPESLMRAFWKTYVYDSDLVENPYIIPRDDWKNWYICYDVYNASNIQHSFSTMFFATGAKWDSRGTGATMVPGKWVTVKTSVDHIASLSSTWRVWNGMQPEQYYLKEDRITDPGPVGFTYNDCPTTKDNAGNTIDLVEENYTKISYYLDSFRLVRLEG